ncbi:MAG: hypothetical protein WC529_06710 [Candidatus Margulisiibacteriota bacterium]
MGNITAATSRSVFQRRIYKVRTGFPEAERRIQKFQRRLETAEKAGNLLHDKYLLAELKRTETLSRRMLGDLTEALKANPALAVPAEIVKKVLYVHLNARLLLSRLDKLRNARSFFLADQRAIEQLEAVYNVHEESLLSQAIDRHTRS